MSSKPKKKKRTCAECGARRHQAFWYKNPTGGHRCAKCYVRAVHVANPEKRAEKNAYAREWRRENRDRMCVCNACGATKPGKRMVGGGRGWCTDCWSRTSKAKYANLCYEAKRRGLAVAISLEEYEALTSTGLCSYCRGTLPERGYGLDRKDHSLGYVHTAPGAVNAVAACKQCNYARRRFFSHDEWQKVAELLMKVRGGTLWPRHKPS
jgi:hypothetical protein